MQQDILERKRPVLESPLRRESLHYKITRTIALEILRGDPDALAQMLTSEIDLARHFDVSRTVMRESIKVLAAKGLLEVRPKTGVRVRNRRDWNLLDPELLQWQCEAGVDESFIRNLCQVRLILEPSTAELAALHASVEDDNLIQHCCAEMASNVDNFERFVSADVEFHQAVSSATHNDLLIQVNRTILQALRVTQGLFKDRRAGVLAALPLHKQVADVISKRDAHAARAAMYLLVKHAEEDIYQVVQSSDHSSTSLGLTPTVESQLDSSNSSGRSKEHI